MLYSSSLLSKYLTTDIDPEEISDLLTLRTCEVEEIHKRELPDDVVIWYVTETRNHPDADKLTVCQVDCGEKGSYQICCGAGNVRKGLFVVVALPGCHLPAINLTIAPRELRGEASNGMICSKEELGIAEDLEEKWIRALMKGDDVVDSAKGTLETVWDMDDLTKYDLGVSLAKKYPFLQGRVLDVENKTITHRPDMFGHFWLAVELDTLLEKKITTSTYTDLVSLGKSAHIFSWLSTQPSHNINVEVTSNKVVTYCTILLENITTHQSSLSTRIQMMELWLQSRSYRVDLSNIFMYLTGQPIHFFDADKVSWWLTIRFAKKGERFVDLFGKEHQLTEDDTVIADKEKICALAGIVWSNTSWVDDKTTRILAEVANFDPVAVRKTWTRLWLRTDAELRYEKTINPLWSLICVKELTTELVLNWTSPSWVSFYVDERSNLDVLKDISVDRWRVAQMMWDDSKNSLEKYTDLLESIWCDVSGENITVPARRSPDDLEVEACIIEEIARLSWFEHIDPVGYQDEVSFIPYSPLVSQRRNVESLLIDRHGFDQVETYPWILDTYVSLSGMETSWLYQMENYLTPEQQYLRPTIIRSMLESIEKNASFFDECMMFDIGNVWKSWSVWSKEWTGETIVLWIWMYQSASKTSWSDHSSSLFLKMKSLVDDLLTTCGAKWKLLRKKNDSDLFHPLQQAEISLNGKQIWSVQVLHPYIAEQVKLDGNDSILLAEIDLTLLWEISESQKKWTRGMSSYETLQDQLIRRDLSFVIDHEKWFGDVTGAVRRIKEVVDVQIFDVYAWEHIWEGKKSIWLRFKMAGDGSLTTEQINEVMTKAIWNVESIGGVLR